MYQPTLARFLSRDPIQSGVEVLYPAPDMRNHWNPNRQTQPYVHVQNNPINFSDPSGLVVAAVRQLAAKVIDVIQSASDELICPQQCKSQTKCKFEISLRVDCTSGKPIIKLKLQYTPTRPRNFGDLRIVDCGPLACYGGFNRAEKGNTLVWKLASGEECSVSEKNFPGRNPCPMLNLSPACDASVSFNQGPGWGEYSFTGATSITTGFTIDTQCHCGTGDVPIEGPANPNEDNAIATTTGTLYFGHGRSGVSCP